MNDHLFHLGAWPVRLLDLLIAGMGLAVLLLVLLFATLARANRARAAADAARDAAAAERAHELDDKLAELNQLQAALTGRMQGMAEIFGSRQGDLVKHLSERLDGLQHRMGQGLEAASQRTGDTLGALNERLAVIDAAQKNLTELTQEVVGLKDVRANKQARGAYGQARMEAIIRDGLPAGAFEFPVTLANGKRPDCIIRLPGDPRPLVIDAKFPLESFT
ncbi:MAG: DNA recombination protein RmuC, partial [Beijerinckiaceae bacterium]